LVFDGRDSSFGNPIGISDEGGWHVNNFVLLSWGSDGHQDDGFEFLLGHVSELVDGFFVGVDFVVFGNFSNISVEDGHSVGFFNFRSVFSSESRLERDEFVLLDGIKLRSS